MRHLPNMLTGFLASCIGWLAWASLSSAASLRLEDLQQPWPKQTLRHIEVGRHQVMWRHRLSRTDGLFAGVRFQAPTDQQTTWRLATDYSDIGKKTPGVEAVRFLEQTDRRQVIELDVNVLWKKLTLRFEVEQDPPRQISFRLANLSVIAYEGLCTFQEQSPSGAIVEVSTRLHMARPVPMRLLLAVERMTLLQGVREFLKTCEQQAQRPAMAGGWRGAGPPGARSERRR